MSNAARFYWAKLEKAKNMLQASKNTADLDNAQDVCCQLVNEFRCPRLCQIEAWKLRAQCYPDNFWFAKAQLDGALETVAKCEEDRQAWGAEDRDMAALAEARKEVEAMLKDRTTSYAEEWKEKGRVPAPTMDEWYKIVKPERGGKSEAWEFLEPRKGSDLPFEYRHGKPNHNGT